MILVWVYFLPLFILPYVIVWFFLLELLNRQKEYTAQKNYRLYNFIFVAYVVVLFNRFLHFKLSHLAREIINRGEHLLFSFVVCLAILQFLRLKFFRQYSFTWRILITSLIFQSIGILNEIYQASWEAGRLSAYFSADATHDILTNIAGNTVFVIFAAIVSSNKRDLPLTGKQI